MPWQNLFLCPGEVEQIQKTVRSLGYELYDPFGETLTSAYTHRITLFIAPQSGQWTQITGEFEASFISQLSGICLYLAGDTQGETIQIYKDGQRQELIPTLSPFASQTCVQQALAVKSTASRNEDIPLDILPDDLQGMAQNLESKQITRLFNKFMKRINMGGDGNAARDLLRNSTIAQSPRILALMQCLGLQPMPDFVTLRTAYQLHLRRQKNAPTYPGDAEALAAVPDALAYIPVYGGKIER